MEPLTPEEKERFLAHVRAQGRSLTSEEQYALFGPPPERQDRAPTFRDVAPMEAAELQDDDLARLAANFFPELDAPAGGRSLRLVQGVIFDFDHTLAQLAQPLETLLKSGAEAAEAYMRSTGMDLPPDFAPNIVEARRFRRGEVDGGERRASCRRRLELPSPVLRVSRFTHGSTGAQAGSRYLLCA